MSSLSLLKSIPKIISQSELVSYLDFWIVCFFSIGSWSFEWNSPDLGYSQHVHKASSW